VSTDRLDAMRRSAMARSLSWHLSAACYSALDRKTVSTWDLQSQLFLCVPKT
jgi:starch synthase